MKPTQQQQNIISAAKERKNLSIQARAGAAKTTTCVMVAEEVVKPSLYISFNKDIAEEAKGKFPSHVVCQTIHSIAYKAIIKFPKSAFGKRLNAVLLLSDITPLLEGIAFHNEEDAFDFTLTVREIITSFCQSDAKDLGKFVYTQLEGFTDDLDLIGQYQKVCISYWLELTNEKSSVGISHDIYLKMYQLSEPVLMYDVIYLDEAQDSNPVTLDIVLRQTHAQLIIVGDPYQAIYAWRGAVNAFSNLRGDFVELELTESFRYTQEIADKAKNVLSIFKDVDIIGLGSIEKFNPESNDYAIICRNNLTILAYLIAEAKQGRKVATNVNLKEVFAKVYHVAALMAGSEPKYPNKELSVYKNYKELKKASEKLVDIRQLIKITMTLSEGNSIFNNINKIKEIVTNDKNEAAYFITTAHKSKGLEFDKVTLDSDMLQWDEEECTFNEWAFQNPQEINLIYVAVTRAKYTLELPLNLKEVLEG